MHELPQVTSLNLERAFVTVNKTPPAGGAPSPLWVSKMLNELRAVCRVRRDGANALLLRALHLGNFLKAYPDELKALGAFEQRPDVNGFVQVAVHPLLIAAVAAAPCSIEGGLDHEAAILTLRSALASIGRPADVPAK